MIKLTDLLKNQKGHISDHHPAKAFGSVIEDVDKQGNIHAKTKKELKAAIAKAMKIILSGKVPDFDIINGMTGEMIAWSEKKNEYIWQPSAIPYAERELK
jgi:hypothetical protein